MAPCFFCLQDSRKYFKSPQDLSEDAPVFVDNLFPLRHISRFLNLFEANDIHIIHDGNGNSKISKHFKKTLFQFANDSMVSVCENCSEMMKEFTELYHLMEVTKLRLNWCVQRMHGVMTKTKDQSTFLDSDNGENLLGIVRTKTMDRMTVMASLPPLPRVGLHRVRKRRRIDNHPVQSRSNSNFSSQILSPDVGASITNLVKLLVSKPNKEASPSTKPSSVDFVNCPHCRAQFKAAGKRAFKEWMLRQHTLQYHCDIFFPHHKQDSVTPSQFKKILAELLFRDLIREDCVFCPEKFSVPGPVGSKNRLYKISKIKSHFVEFHFPQLEDILRQIQENPDLPRVLEDVNPTGRECQCGVYIPSPDAQTRHDKFHCVLKKGNPLGKLNSRKETDQPKPKDADGVQNVVSLPPAVKLERFLDENDDGDDDDDGDDHDKSEIQDTPPGLSFSKYVKCSYCLAQFPTTLSNGKRPCYGEETLRRHLLQYHAHHYFPNHRLADTVSESQYHQILVELLFKDLIDEDVSTCLYCKKPFGLISRPSDKGMVNSRRKMHYIQKHYEELEKKLRIIQMDAELSEKLNACHSKGRMCRRGCGVYIPNLKSQAFHNKMYCTMTTTTSLTEGSKGSPDTNLLLSSSSTSIKKKKMDCSGSESLSTASDDFVSCRYCRYKCTWEQSSASMPRHHLRFHPEHYFPDVKFQVFGLTSDQFQRVLHDILFPELEVVKDDGDNILSCQFCDLQFKNRDAYTTKSALRKHLVYSHTTQVTNRLEVILQEKDLEERIVKANPRGVSCPCGMYLPDGFGPNQGHHEKFQCNLKVTTTTIPEEVEEDEEEEVMDEIPLSSTSKKDVPTASSTKKKKDSTSANRLTSCPYCRYVCKAGHASASLARHLLRFHPQYHFPHVKYEKHGVTSDQFQRVLHDILFPELTLETGGVFSCKFCNYTFKGKDSYSSNASLRRHLVYCHMKELTERLHAILGDRGSLEGRIAKANTVGVSCTCGMYLPNNGVGIGSSQSYHDKVQCNLKAKEKTKTGRTIIRLEVMEMEVDYEEGEEGGQYLEDDFENKEGDVSGQEEEELKFNCETTQMTSDRTRTVNEINEVFVDESDPLEL